MIAKDFIKKVSTEYRVPSIDEIKKLLKDNYLLICSINANTLDGYDGYSGHAVVIRGCTDSTLILNDPGLPARENLEVSHDSFYKAWAYPDDKAPNLSAFKLIK